LLAAISREAESGGIQTVVRCPNSHEFGYGPKNRVSESLTATGLPLFISLSTTSANSASKLRGVPRIPGEVREIMTKSKAPTVFCIQRASSMFQTGRSSSVVRFSSVTGPEDLVICADYVTTNLAREH
jgi:hypothetical protein